MKKTMGLAAIIVTTLFGGAAMAECGSVKIAAMNWASASFLAEVDAFVLSQGYGCDVEVVPGDTMPTFTSMSEKGTPEVAPEMWTNAYQIALDAAIGEGKLSVGNPGPITGLGEGWWILPHTKAAHPELKTVLDIIDHPELFPNPENPSRGALVGCPAGWGCQLATQNLYRAFDMEAKGWDLIDPGSAAGLDGSIAKASARKENWFGYYWNPTSTVGRYDMQSVPFGVEWGGSDNWDNCIVKPMDECADPKPSSWTQSSVNTILTSGFADAQPQAAQYFAARVFPGVALNSMLVWMDDNQAIPADAAIEFLKNHEDIWGQWVSEEAAAKIKASL
ncbi:MAG: ABC transporter substrate-binding protein [Alphaproteobacteria bacterium]|jgi:glycine betaine/proline transport system substrate-binding protein|nr:ABC transporter substrate-binding protein [Alphaproteobacteria bacterium]